MPLFGQVLAALYQDDIVEEEDIRQWHAQPSSKGEGHKAGKLENMKRCWTIGARMIEQFDEQESDDDSSEGGMDQSQVKFSKGVEGQERTKEAHDLDRKDEGEDQEDEDEEDEEEEEEEEDEDEDGDGDDEEE